MNNNIKISWSSLADFKYFKFIAHLCLPSWNKLPGDKFLVTDDLSIKFDAGKKIDWQKICNYDCEFQKKHTPNKLKTDNFWRKMQSQIWAIRNLQEYDFVVLLDSDIEVTNFDKEKFFKIIDKFVESKLVWATGRSQSRLHDSGVIMFNMKDNRTQQVINEYENIWESGKIRTLKKSYDGNAVESMLDDYPSFKIMNTDYGKGLHIYDFGLIHYGSKEPKRLRQTKTGPGQIITKEWTNSVNVKKYKGSQIGNNY